MLKELFVKKGSDFAGRPTEDTYMRLKLIYPEGNKGIVFSTEIRREKKRARTSRRTRFITTSKQSLGPGNDFTRVCHSVHVGGRGLCMMSLPVSVSVPCSFCCSQSRGGGSLSRRGLWNAFLLPSANEVVGRLCFYMCL